MRTRGGSARFAASRVEHPLPVRQLLGKQPEVAEARQAAEHRRGADLDRPALRHRLVDAPAALVLVLVAGEHGVRLVPVALRQPRRPQRLRLGAVDDDCAEALELAPAAAVEQRVVGKAGGLDELQADDAGCVASLGPWTAAAPTTGRIALSLAFVRHRRPSSRIARGAGKPFHAALASRARDIPLFPTAFSGCVKASGLAVTERVAARTSQTTKDVPSN